MSSCTLHTASHNVSMEESSDASTETASEDFDKIDLDAMLDVEDDGGSAETGSATGQNTSDDVVAEKAADGESLTDDIDAILTEAGVQDESEQELDIEFDISLDDDENLDKSA